MQKLLDYYATHPSATLRYKASGMVPKAHSDASYFSESQARSRSGGFSTWYEQAMTETDKMEQLWSY